MEFIVKSFDCLECIHFKDWRVVNQNKLNERHIFKCKLKYKEIEKGICLFFVDKNDHFIMPLFDDGCCYISLFRMYDLDISFNAHESGEHHIEVGWLRNGILIERTSYDSHLYDQFCLDNPHLFPQC